MAPRTKNDMCGDSHSLGIGVNVNEVYHEDKLKYRKIPIKNSS
jgi:hypothetical protein